MTRYLPLIVFGVMLNAAAQLALRQGMRNIGYIVTAFAGRLFFNESIGVTRWAGIIVI